VSQEKEKASGLHKKKFACVKAFFCLAVSDAKS
jgi:hypothetical protein